MNSECSIVIDRPIEEVFDYTNDHVAEWSLVAVENEVVEDKGGVGTRLHMVTEERGKRMDFDGVVTRYDRPTASAVEMTGRYFDIAAEYTFEDLGGSTRVTQRSTAEGKGIMKAMFFLFGWMMKKSSCDALEKELASLKQHAEERGAAAGTAASQP